jgi:hypothetical protein
MNMSGVSKYNWTELKIEYFSGPWVSVTSFLAEKKIPLVNNKQTVGWVGEKEQIMKRALQLATERIVAEDVNDEMVVRRRQAALARKTQLKGIMGLEKHEPRTADEARKVLQTGLIQERDALGINISPKGGGPNLTQVNINFPKTKLDKILDGTDAEGVLRLLAEVKRRKATLRIGTDLNNAGEAKVVGQGTG